MEGIIVKALSGFYYVELEDNIYECKARGNFRKNGISPLVGDRVNITIIDEKHGVIEQILKRKNELKRPPVANIDKLFIVSSFSTPAPNTYIIDKLTAIAEYNGIEPIIVFNKCDMGDFSELEAVYKNAGFKVYVISAVSGLGMESFCEELKGSVSAFTGNSGVGKSSILKSILSSSVIETGEVSQKLGRGRHTTRHVEIYKLNFGGFVADTPGFSALDYNETNYDFKEKLPFLFRDFSDYVDGCRFTSCTHINSKGCEIISAVQSGKIAETRYRSYCELFEEMKDLKPWEIAKRKK